MRKGTLRIGLIGAGMRSKEHIKNIFRLGERITGLCDVSETALNSSCQLILSMGGQLPPVYGGYPEAYEEMLQKEEFDVVIVSVTWDLLVPITLATMRAGVPYVGIEASSINSLNDCWDLVDECEKNHCQLMILENVCYRQDILSVLNMTRAGLFGELLHCRCGYEHDLREIKFGDTEKLQSWRLQHSIDRNGDLYPTHGIGPVASFLDINYGNRFVSLVSMSTQSRGLKKHIVKKGGENHPYADVEFKCGDIVTTMIKCANGQTVIVTHDTNSPRPYSLGFRVQGTNGLWYNDGDLIYIEGKSEFNNWEKSEDLILQYTHPLWKSLQEVAKEAGHGGSDLIMMYDFLQSIRNNTATPFDVYDAVTWMSISPLSEMSIASGSIPVEFPDFTRGKWINRNSGFALLSFRPGFSDSKLSFPSG